ncbi:MAG TPA: haloacid dehalogenase type II [Planctomycetaceae bacterium]|nr:haloacid dehalogenase type II [Planctomycetaceae bacterium]
MMVFDIFGTTVDWRSSVIAEGERLGRKKGLKVDWGAFADAWRAAYGPSMNRVRKGKLPWTKLDALHRASLDELLRRFKIEGLSEDERADFNRAWHRLRPWPDAVEGLTRLRERYVIAPLSNGNLSLLTNLAKFAGLPWDCVLSAELVRHYKPDPEVYRSASEFFDLRPSEVMMVAAHRSDLEVPKKLGMRTAYVHRPYEGGTGRGSPMPPAGSFDLLVADFGELASRLGA